MATPNPKLMRAVKALPAQRWVSLIEAFPRVKAAVGGSDELAVHDLTMQLRAGKLTAAGRQIVRGAGDRYFIFAREFWLRAESAELDPHHPFRTAEALQRLEGRLLPKGRGQWWFFFDRKQFDELYPPSAPKASRAQDLIRRIAADEWPGGYAHVGTAAIIKRVGDKLQKMHEPVPKRDVFLRALGRRKG